MSGPLKDQNGLLPGQAINSRNGGDLRIDQKDVRRGVSGEPAEFLQIISLRRCSRPVGGGQSEFFGETVSYIKEK